MVSPQAQEVQDPQIVFKERGKKMKRFIIIVMILASMAVCVAIAHAEPGSKVLLIPREGNSRDLELMLTKEVGVMVAMLEKAGFEVVVATASGAPIVATNTTLKPDLKLADVKIANYAGLIMACMAVGLFPGTPQPPETAAIVKQVEAEGKPIAAQLGAVIVLAEAGILIGRRYAFVWDPLGPSAGPYKDPRFAGAIYGGNNVVQDGNIITSGVCPFIRKTRGLPDATSELTQGFIAELKKQKKP